MKKNIVIGSLVAISGLSSIAFGQAAPSSAQNWEMRYQIQRFGLGDELLTTSFASAANPGGGLIDAGTGVGYSTNVAVGRVNITLQARIGIARAAGATFSSVNLGISRIGGPNVGTNPLFRLSLTDIVAASFALRQGSIGRGLTGEGDDNTGNALAGNFSPFRSAFVNGGQPDANNVGRNSDTNNGIFTNPANGALVLSGLTGSRGFYEGAFGGAAFPVGSAGVSIDGSIVNTPFASYYAADYVPNNTIEAARLINGSSVNQTATYLFASTGNLGSSSTGFLLPNFNFQFAVPTPGAAALMGLGALAVCRRRR